MAMSDESSEPADPQILSAYFGANNFPGVQLALAAGCALGTTGVVQDGMPIVFDVKIDPSTLDASDFEVTHTNIFGFSTTVSPNCVGLPPADDDSENRTVLTVGHYGNGSGVQEISVVGQLLDEDGRNLQGLTFDQVTPLGTGPSMIDARPLSPDEWEPFDDAPMTGNECAVGTVQIVQVTWQGGITNASNTGELDDDARMEYLVTLDTPDGMVEVVPFDLGDLNDNDNYNDLCLDVPGTPVAVSMVDGIVSDPSGFTNLETSIAVAAP